MACRHTQTSRWDGSNIIIPQLLSSPYSSMNAQWHAFIGFPIQTSLQLKSSYPISFYFAGPKKGRLELFVDNLPGFPDNIRASATGKSFYVALFSHRSRGTNEFFQSVGPWPGVRKVIGQVRVWRNRSANAFVLPRFCTNCRPQQCTSSSGIPTPHMALCWRLTCRETLSSPSMIPRALSSKTFLRYGPHKKFDHWMVLSLQVRDDGNQFLYLASFANNYIGRISKKWMIFNFNT